MSKNNSLDKRIEKFNEENGRWMDIRRVGDKLEFWFKNYEEQIVDRFTLQLHNDTLDPLEVAERMIEISELAPNWWISKTHFKQYVKWFIRRLA